MRARIGLLLALGAVTCDRIPESATGSRPASPDDLVAVGPSSPVLAAGPGEVDMPEAPPEDEVPPDQPVPEPEPVDVEEPAEPDVPVPPDDYGLIAPPHPAPPIEDLTLHGLAGYEVVAIYAEPDIDAARLGYLRIGTRLKVTEKISGVGCSKGWHALAGGGYACASRGLVVGTTPPYLHVSPPPPKTEEAFPYEYAYVRTWNTPMYWRIPEPAERAYAAEKRRELEAKREGKPLPSAAPPAPKDDAAAATPEPKDDAAGLDALPKPDADADADAAPSPDAAPKVAAAESPAAAPEPEPEPEITLPLNPQTPWMEKGFFVSLAGKVEDDGTSWWQTARGGFVEADAAYKYTPKDFSGVALPEGTEFPFGFAMAKTTKVYRFEDDGKLAVVEELERRTFVDLLHEVDIRGTSYFITMEGGLIKTKDLRLAEPQPLPTGLQPWERWIDVTLAKQMLVAYEGERPVYVTLVSTGKKGSKAEPFDTPTGRWRIRSKHVSTTMDGGSATDGNYSIQDVPWTMYFHDSYALHGAFWHESFGRVRSHGCVNLGPSDAHWLFTWTTPFLPEGWHGVHAHEGSPGTTVVVRE